MAIAVRGCSLPKPSAHTEGQRVAGALRRLRQKRRLTQRQVAENWGISLDGYRPWEQGRRQLRVGQIAGLARALTVSEQELRQALGMGTESPDDAPMIERRFTADLDTITREVEDLPTEVAERVIRNFKAVLEIIHTAQHALDN